MSRVFGVIAEFNPFHSGHRFLFETIKNSALDSCNPLGEESITVVVMSGNFTQRGDFAVSDKWSRAKAAIEEGADLVIELPCEYATGSAGDFAKGGTGVLEALGGIDYLAFGSETGDIKKLTEFVEFEEANKEKTGEVIRRLSKEGLSYPAARAEAAAKLGFSFCSTEEAPLIAAQGKPACQNKDFAALSEPNNILAAEYIRNLKKIRPFAVKRNGTGHTESASAIRRELAKKPEYQRMEEIFFDLIRGSIITKNAEELDSLRSAGEGLGNRLKNEIRYAESRKDLIMRVKSKRYTYGRISRLLLETLLEPVTPGLEFATPGFSETSDRVDRPKENFYIRPLAMNKKGAEFLKKRKKADDSTVFVDNIKKTAALHPEIYSSLMLMIKTTDIYNIITGKDMYKESDYVRKTVIVK